MPRFLVAPLVVLVACTPTSDTSGDEADLESAPASDADPTDVTPSADVVEDPTGSAPPTQSSSGESDGGSSPKGDAGCDTVDRVRLVRSQSTPGGHRLHLQVIDPDGIGVEPSDVERCLAVTDERLGELESAVSAVPNDGGATLIVARWSPGEVEASRVAIDEIVSTLPVDERVAVWAWSDDVIQVVGSTTDRDRIAQRLDAVWTADDATPLDIAAAAEIASEEWEDHREDTLLGLRSIVFVAPELELGERPDIDRDVVVDHWIVRSGDGGRVVEAGDDHAAITEAAERVVERITRDRAVPLTIVDVCDDGGSLDLTLSVGESRLRDFGVGDAAIEHVGVSCSVGARPTLTPDPLTRVEVTFDDGQRREFEEAVAIADELSGRDRLEGDVDPEWTGSISFDDGRSTAPFEASFRGQSSIECERRNWSIDLEGGDARHPIAETGTDEFALVSLCSDEGYVSTLVGSSVMAEFDLWTQARGATTFEIDGEPRGVYLVVEDPDEDLRFESSRVRTVLRRRYDALGHPPDIEYIADLTSRDDASILSVYDQLVEVAATTSGDEMVDALRRRFDLDQYLRWTAVMSMLGSGDHIDELYFVGVESVDAQHEPIIWFTVNGWDPDDLFAPCHRDGRLAIEDPNGLLSCTESLLDRELFADPVVYDLFAATLADVLDEMSPERFTLVADESAAEITRHLDDPDVVAASVELLELNPAATSSDAARATVDRAADRLVAQFTQRRTELIDLLSAYERIN